MTEILFDFYEILVQNIFGSVFMAIMGVALALLLIMFLCKTSQTFIIYWMIFYFMVMGAMYIGALALVLGFLFAAGYTITAVIRFWFRND